MRIINFRPFFIVFISFILGILSVVCFFTNKNYIFNLIELILIFSLILVILSFLKIEKLNFLVHLRKVFVIFIIATLFSQTTTLLTINSLSKREFQEGTYTITGRISQSLIKENYSQLILENVIIEEKLCNFNIKVYVFNQNENSDKLIIGNGISFVGELNINDLFSRNRVTSNVVKDRIFYTATTNTINRFMVGKTSGVESVRLKIKDNLLTNMEEDCAYTAYSMLFGDKLNLNEEIYNIFENCGLVHVLAVSGLNISLLVAMLMFILKKLKIKQPYILVILSLFLIFYCMLCDFSASVFRATIMTICYCFADCFGKEKDSLTTLSFSGVILLIINPLNLMDIGFMLSFSSIFGILLFYKPITNIFKKINFSNKLTDMFALTTSAILGSYPINCLYFEKFQIATFISNIFLLPLFVGTFYLLFAITLINLIMPVSYLYYLLNLCFNIILSLGALIGKMGLIKITSFGLLSVLLWYILIFVSSNYINVKSKHRIIAFMCLFVTISCCIAYYNDDVTVKQNAIFSINQVKNSYVLTTDKNERFLFGVGDGSDYEFNNIKQALKNKRIYSLTGIVVANYSSEMQGTLQNILNEFDVDQLLIPNTTKELEYSGLNFNSNTILFLYDEADDVMLSNKVYFNTLKCNASYFALNVHMSKCEIIISTKTINDSRVEFLNNLNKNCAIFSQNFYKSFENLSSTYSLFIKQRIETSKATILDKKYLNIINLDKI